MQPCLVRQCSRCEHVYHTQLSHCCLQWASKQYWYWQKLMKEQRIKGSTSSWFWHTRCWAGHGAVCDCQRLWTCSSNRCSSRKCYSARKSEWWCLLQYRRKNPQFGLLQTGIESELATDWLTETYCLYQAVFLVTVERGTPFIRLSAKWSYPPPLGNFADIPYLKEQSFLHRIRDVCTL